MSSSRRYRGRSKTQKDNESEDKNEKMKSIKRGDNEIELKRIVKITILLLFLIIILRVIAWIFVLTNVGLLWMGLVLYLLIFSRMPIRYRSKHANSIDTVRTLFTVLAVFMIIMLFFSNIFTIRIDNAKYFEQELTYDSGLPFYTPVNGSELRIVDYWLASAIMDKSNTFGSNYAVWDIHLGKYNGRTYWIGAVIFDGIIASSEKNMIKGFIAVDFSDPTADIIVIHQEFPISQSLILNRDLQRFVWNIDHDYLAGENYYFSQNADTGDMELIVPYSIRDRAFFGKSGFFISQEVVMDGGVLIIDKNGDLIGDFKDRTQLPDHAQIQMYDEWWLERGIGYWGQSLVEDHKVSWSAGLPWVKSQRKLGIDDDVRVVVNPDNNKDVQYVMLDSTGSSNQILRGGIKTNATGIYYYNWESYGYIDTDTAHQHVRDTVTSLRETQSHGYTTLLPILYPYKENVSTLEDYAYIVPLQLGESRFGGIAITDPSDTTGTNTIVEFVEPEETRTVSEVIDAALAKYNALISGNTNTPNPTNQHTGNFTISSMYNYIRDGNTEYIFEGYFDTLDANITVVFSQRYISDESKWIRIATSEIDDILIITIVLFDSIYYAHDIIL
ncbi:MAG: hypothetical protein OEZ01_13535 [Candidatus Heimdallarchaeota archaeon]|nr:hypothetical protein [Candidatus Heimdallarchaeota archaeon]